MTGDPPFECGPDCPAPDHHDLGQRIEASDNPTIHTGNSTQAQMIEAAANDVAVIQDIKAMYLAPGGQNTRAEAGQWLTVAEQDHAAAVAGIDYRDLAAMGPESVMTEPEPCGYPAAREPEAGL